ncbi:MAG: phage shock protein PspA [Pseudomonadota bacterium]
MGIFSRLTDIINSNIIHMLDKAEDPEKMVRLMIQEMEDTLVEVKSQAAKYIADKKTIERNIELLKENQNMWQSKAELAVEKGRDDLAKAAIEEKAKKQRIENDYNIEFNNLNEILDHFKKDIKQLEDKLSEAKTKQKTIIARKQSAASRLEMNRQIHKSETSKALNKFDKFERDIDRMEGEIEAMKIKGGKKSLEDEFEKLEHENEIETELQKLKEKLGK